jgi:hypothetical protein
VEEDVDLVVRRLGVVPSCAEAQNEVVDAGLVVEAVLPDLGVVPGRNMEVEEDSCGPVEEVHTDQVEEVFDNVLMPQDDLVEGSPRQGRVGFQMVRKVGLARLVEHCDIDRTHD